jgi:hypothetical protein
VFSLISAGLDTWRHPLVVARHEVIDGHNRWYAGEILRERVWALIIHANWHRILPALRREFTAREAL